MDFRIICSNPRLQGLTEELTAISKTLTYVSVLTAYLQQLNTTMDEPAFSVRVVAAAMSTRMNASESTNLADVILEQERLRADYFRARLVLEFLLNQVKELLANLTWNARIVVLSLEELAVVKTTAAAKAVLDEDKSNHEAQRAFRSALSTLIDHWSSDNPHPTSWAISASSDIPLELQTVGCLNAHKGAFGEDLSRRWCKMREEIEAVLVPDNEQRNGLLQDFRVKYAPGFGSPPFIEVPAAEQLELLPLLQHCQRYITWAAVTADLVAKWLIDAANYVKRRSEDGESGLNYLAYSSLLGASATLIAVLEMHAEYSAVCEAFANTSTSEPPADTAIIVFTEVPKFALAHRQPALAASSK